ncbi:MAG: TIGR03085 family metal-binding protein [Acidimicrobiales bacterium]
MAQSLAQSERQSLCNLLEARGPLAPTLCEGWTTSDLAAHLFVRESRPLASPGIVLPPFAHITQREMEKAKRELGYGGLITRVRSGPPYPMRLFDAQVNVMEYFVHHEDVRRAEAGWEPRSYADLDAALWRMVQRLARIMARRLSGAGLELVAPGFGSVVAKAADPVAVVTGGPQELVLLLFGRKGAVRLEIEGPDAAKAALDSARLGI